MTKLPPARMSQRLTDWDAVAERILEVGPNEHFLMFKDTPRLRGILNTINQGQAKPLRALGGVVRGIMRDSRNSADGRRGDVWIIWDKDGDPTSRYAQRYLDNDKPKG